MFVRSCSFTFTLFLFGLVQNTFCYNEGSDISYHGVGPGGDLSELGDPNQNIKDRADALFWRNLPIYSRGPPPYAPPKDWKYNTTPELVDNKINVHMVMHTHDDTGWQITVDQYFYQYVYYIVDSVVDSLAKNKDRKFIYVETAFFARWYDEQPKERRELAKTLVKEGRLEFINGGWCMHDEAAPTYTEMVDQTTRGHQFLFREFGVEASPRGTWQVDPFGHSNTQAWLLGAMAGMESMFWGRTDYQDLAARKHLKKHSEEKVQKSFEWIWEGSDSLGSSARIFAGEIYGGHIDGNGGYGGPFNFEDKNSKQVQDDPARHDYNVDEWMEAVVSFAKAQANKTQTNHIMWAMGTDFCYKNAEQWYHNVDKLIHYAKQNGTVNLLYSTPSLYVDAKRKCENEVWELRKDDVFPLADDAHHYWTGYFTSRPALKKQVRVGSALLNAARQIEVLSGITKDQVTIPPTRPSPVVGQSWTDAFEGAIGVATHHDGMSGTERQSVTDDYEERITDAQSELEQGISLGLSRIFGFHVFGEEDSNSIKMCRDLNMSVCEFGRMYQDESSFYVILWNSLSREVNHTFRIPVRSTQNMIESQEQFSVQFATSMEGENTNIVAQMIEIDERTFEIPLLYLNSYGLSEDQIRSQKIALKNNATHILTGKVTLPPVGGVILKVERKQSLSTKTSDSETVNINVVENGVYRISLDEKTNEIHEIENLISGVKSEFSIAWGWYESSEGGCTVEVEMDEEGNALSKNYGCDSQKSGAYIFRPNSSTFFYPGEVPFGGKIPTEIVTGELVTEIRQRYSDWVTHVIRLVKDEPYIQVEYTVGPIPLKNKWLKDPTKRMRELGKEVSVRYRASSLASNGTFYADSNGREMITRRRNMRGPSYPPLQVNEPVAGNYYPVNAMISVEDEMRKDIDSKVAQLCVIPDVTQGGASLHDGEVELMVHRRLVADDSRGVEEPLNETMCGCNDINAEPGKMGAHGHLGDGGCWCEGLTIRGSHYLIFDHQENANQLRRQLVEKTYFSPFIGFSVSKESETLIDAKVSRYSALKRDLPINVNMMTFTNNYADFHDGLILMRLVHGYGVDEHPTLSQPVTVSLKDMFTEGVEIVSAKEMSLTANQPVERLKRKDQKEWSVAPLNKDVEQQMKDHAPFTEKVSFDSDSMRVTLRPMEIRTFLCELQFKQPLESRSEVAYS